MSEVWSLAVPAAAREQGTQQQAWFCKLLDEERRNKGARWTTSVAGGKLIRQRLSGDMTEHDLCGSVDTRCNTQTTGSSNNSSNQAIPMCGMHEQVLVMGTRVALGSSELRHGDIAVWMDMDEQISWGAQQHAERVQCLLQPGCT